MPDAKAPRDRFDVPRIFAIVLGIIATIAGAEFYALWHARHAESLAALAPGVATQAPPSSDVGSAVAVLARGELPYATGQVLNIDGGMTLQRL